MGKIFAGLILLFFDFNLGSINILPDFVGYLLIHLGMNQVEECESWRNCQVTIAAIVFDVISWLLLALSGGGIEAVVIVFGVIGMAFHLAVTHRVMKGICELEETSGVFLRAEELSKQWKLILVCTIAAYVLAWTGVLAFVAVIINLVATICYLMAYYKSWKTYEDERPGTIN